MTNIQKMFLQSLRKDKANNSQRKQLGNNTNKTKQKRKN